ncbi:MAG: copper resistance protein CopC [Alphaproteobacteria bacterium]|nr:copper resistance protein CopC [Alphaproteobacteria bacterium]
MLRRYLLSRRALLRLAPLALAATLPPAPLTAHALVTVAEPTPGATVSASGFDIRLTYNSRIDHRRSKLVILNEEDRETVVPQLSESGAPNRVIARAPALPPGRYRLRWQVLAVDGHVTRGDIPFRVGR